MDRRTNEELIMQQVFHDINIKTKGQGLYDFTKETINWLNKQKIINGNYKDVKIQLNKNWSNEDVASKYLGLYELEVQECIINSQKNKKLRKRKANKNSKTK